MTTPSNSAVQNLLPVQAYFNVDGSFNTFIGQGKPFYATANPVQSGLAITNSTLDSSPIGSITPSTGAFTNISTTTGTISTNASNPTDIVNYLTLQAYAAGISWKNPVTAATTTNITLSGLQTVDTVSLVAGNTVLVKNQTNNAQNGIYQVNSGAWTYATGSTTWSQYVSALVFVEFGGQAGSAWYCTAQPGGTLGTTAMTWSNFSVSSTYTAGTGLTLSGYQFSITNTGVAANTYGSATATPVFAVNAQGQITSVTNTTITPAIGNVTGLATGMLTFLQTPTSANLAATVTDETGSGALVFANSPTFITPALGTPASGVLTNATGLPLTTGVTGILGIANGGTGLSTTPANGALDIGNGTGFTRTTLTAGTAIGITNAAGSITIANTGVTSLTGGTGISVSASTGGVTITNTATMTYPGAGIANSTGSAWGTSYSTTGTGTVVALATSPSFTTPALGTPSAAVLTNATGLPVSTGISGLGTGVATALAVNVGSAGAFVTNGGALGTPSSGVATNLTGTASGLSIGGNAATATTATSATTATTATNATNIAITDNTSSSSTWYPVLSANSSGNNAATTSSTKMSFVPNTGVLTTTGHTLGATGLTFADGSTQVSHAVPVINTYSSGSGTYTTPTNAKYLIVEMVAGGGGGCGGGTGSFHAGTAGGSTTFGSNTCTAGAGGPVPWSGTGGSGGSVTVGTGTSLGAFVGATGGGSAFVAGGNINYTVSGGTGGSSPYGGAGAGSTYVGGGGAAAGNTGSGGGGGGTGNDVAQCYSGTGGGSGGFIKVLITSPAATYSYAVGAGGAAGAGGSGSNAPAGGAGGSGWISVTAYF